MGSLLTYKTKEWLYSAIDMENNELIKQILQVKTIKIYKFPRKI